MQVTHEVESLEASSPAWQSVAQTETEEAPVVDGLIFPVGQKSGLGRFRLHVFSRAAVETVGFESGASIGVVLAWRAGGALTEGGVLDAIATNRTVFAVGDGSAASIGIELSCRADDTLGVVLGTVVLANRTNFASPSSGCLARASCTCGVGDAASIVSVGP